MYARRHLVSSILLLAPLVSAQERMLLFDTPMVVQSGWDRLDRLVDSDWDGDWDAVGVWTDNQRPSIANIREYRNEGEGRFGGWRLIQQVEIPRNAPDSIVIAIGDFDADGHDDIAAVGEAASGIALTRPDRAPQWHDSPGVAARPITAIAADFDLDGRDDLAVLMPDGVRLFGIAGTAMTLAGNWPHTGVDIASADVDDDGFPEIVLLQNDRVRFLGVDPGSPLAAGRVHGTGQAHSVVCGDIDNDSDEDVVVFGASTYTVLRRTTSELEPEAPQLGGPATDLADIDGDGDLDGVCCGGGGSRPTQHNNRVSKFEIARNDGKGRFSVSRKIQGLGARHLAGAADVDGDGDVDLVAGRAVFYNRDSFELDPPDTMPAISPRWSRAVDFDRDGDLDLGVGLHSVVRNLGDGSYETITPVVPAAPAGHQWIGPGYGGDFDGDGDHDLIAGLSSSSGIDMRLLANRGGGHFVDAGPAAATGTTFQPNPNPPQIGAPQHVTADVDADGDLDIVDVWRFSDFANSRIWLNDGRGFFTRGADLPQVQVLAVASFDGDPNPDLLIVDPYSSGSGQWFVRLATGPGTFDTDVYLYSTLPERRPSVVDMDGDGDNDIVSSDGSAVFLFRNDGTANFTKTDLRVGALKYGYALASRVFTPDLNYDGRPDLVAWPAKYGNLKSGYVMLQDETGALRFQGQFVMDPYAILDADGDGDHDLVGERVVPGSTFHGLAAGGWRQYGDTVAGAGGMAPTLGARGPLRPGHAVESRITGALGGTVGVYFTGLERAQLRDFPLPGLTIQAWPILAPISLPMGGPIGAPGAGEIVLPYFVPGNFRGISLYVQAFLFDAAAPSSVSQTNGLRVTYGR